ncbi:MAG: SDR family oxidoreductase, partial [Odoribacter sp.]|nr:SDR family oxidoreductase [Odoribacter sp.]
ALGDAVRETEVIDETTPVIEGREHSVYSRSKGEAEKVVWKYVRNGLNAVIVCPSVILGPGMWNRSSSRLFAAAARGIPVYPRGMTGYVDVRDVVTLMIRLAGDGTVRSERFILNGGNHSFRELFTLVAQAYGKRPPCFCLRPWMGEMAWRFLAVVGWLTGKKPAFTRETARTSAHRSCYSSAKVMALYPDFRFHALQETVSYIKNIRDGLCRFSN